MRTKKFSSKKLRAVSESCACMPTALRQMARIALGTVIGGKCGEVIIAQPTRKLRPIDRFELAVCEFQRFFGRCGAGDEEQGRTDEPCDRGASAISLHSRNRSESPAISDQSLIVRTTLEVGRPSAPAVFI